MKNSLPVLLGLGALGVVLLASRGASASTDLSLDLDFDPDPDTAETVMPRAGTPLPPVAEGRLTDVAGWHAEIDDFFQRYGVGDMATAEMVTRLPKARDVDYAIPPREYWENMAYTLDVLRGTGLDLANDVEIRGYRPPWYNEAVGGAPGSTHQYFSAVDLLPQRVGIRRLHDEAKSLWRDRGQHEMGIGMYSNTIHVDTRRGRPASWGSREYLL